MNTQTIIDDQISGQLEGRTDIRVECLDTSKVFNPKLYAQKKFLNGVCRHEPIKVQQINFYVFLNGVCRHELVWR